jgi:hypothetical protein
MGEASCLRMSYCAHFKIRRVLTLGNRLQRAVSERVDNRFGGDACWGRVMQKGWMKRGVRARGQGQGLQLRHLAGMRDRRVCV